MSQYKNIDTRVEVVRRESGGISRSCKFCNEPLHKHDKTREFPDNGPAGSWHYRYVCDNGYMPELEHGDTNG